MKDKGFELVAVNHGDPPDVINKYVDKNKFGFKIGMGGKAGGGDYGVFEQYGVQAYPTNYILDSEGKVVWRKTGFDEAGIRETLKKLGVE